SANGNINIKASSGYKFGCLAKIVNYMKTRHQNGDTHFLTLDEILDETKLLDISMKQKQWLMTEVCSCHFQGPYCSLFIYHLRRKWFLSSTVSHQLYHIFKNEYFPHTLLCRKVIS
ncbi:hypothetical protein AMECASPLE_023955, partial [Ameca splendens]